MENYQFRRLSDALLPDVQRLFLEVFQKRVSLSYLKGKYDTSYLGVKHLCFLAYAGERPVSFYGALPQQFSHPNGAFLAAHTCDSFTVPDHQRKGLHRQLALKTYALMQEHGLKFVYAFHSENTYHSCKKLDWKEGKRMHGYWIGTGGLPWGKIARKLPLVKKAYLNRLEHKLKQLEASPQHFQNSQSGTSGIWQDYQPSFLAYKAFAGNSLIELEGVRFWIKGTGAILVGDAVFQDQAQFLKGLESLKALARSLGLPKILFQTGQGSPLDLALQSFATGFESWRAGYLSFSPELDMDGLKVNFGDLDTF